MNFLRLGLKIINKIYLLLLIAGGIVIALSLLTDRRRLRAGSVKVTKGALITKDKVNNVAAKMSAEASDIVREARQTRPVSSSPENAAAKSLQAVKTKGHHIAVATTERVLTIKEQAQAEFKSIVDEAKKRRANKLR